MLRFIDVFNFHSSCIQSSRIEILKDDDIAAFINARRFVVKVSFKTAEITEIAEALDTSAASEERVTEIAESVFEAARRAEFWAESEERVFEAARRAEFWTEVTRVVEFWAEFWAEHRVAEIAERVTYTRAELKERVSETARVKLWAESEERVSETFLSRCFLLYLSRFLTLSNIKNDEAIDDEASEDVSDDETINNETLRDSRTR